jgi:phage tail-like protein
MLTDFRAASDIRGERIDLSLAWSGPESQPVFRVQRRRHTYPNSVDEGFCILDLGDIVDLFGENGEGLVRIERSIYLPHNTEVESGLQMAQVALYFIGDETEQPYRVVIGHEDEIVADLTEISKIIRTQGPADPWTLVQTLEIFVNPGDVAETLAGTVIVSTGHADGITANRFEWLLADANAVVTSFERITHQDVMASWEETQNPDSGDFEGSLRILDQGLEPQIIYYYRAFVPLSIEQDIYQSERDWRAAAMSTTSYGLGDRLYRLLPSVHQYYDEPDPAQQGQGQLRRFLSIFGAALDQIRSSAEGLRSRHDLPEVNVKCLPHLAQWIGWQLDMTLDPQLLRNDIQQAPEIYRTVGTLPNLRAVVNRLTGWDCKIKEYVHNVFLSNAPETIRLWEIWESHFDGADWTEPTPRTRTDGFDGHPVKVQHAGFPWLVWHADRSGPRQLWLMRDDAGVGPYQALLFIDEGGQLTPPVSEYPAALSDADRLWLFWDSQWDGHWDIWAAWDSGDRPFQPPLGHPPGEDDLPAGPATNLTEHIADDRHPAVVRDANDRIWLFWQSNRRGPTDIWSRFLDPMSDITWSIPERVTTAAFRHEQPAAVFDAEGRLWLFYTSDLGDRRNLYVQVCENALQNSEDNSVKRVWSKPFPVTAGSQRDEAPSAVLWAGKLWLFWQSNRPTAKDQVNPKQTSHDGPWQILGQPWAWNNSNSTPEAAGEVFNLTQETTSDKEPFAIAQDGQLCVVWRSQRRGRNYQSRTFDTQDPEMRARLGTFEDRAHYTYDTGTTDQDLYARDTIGIFLTPNTEVPDLIDRGRRLIKGPLREFLPIQVRPVLFILPAVYEELVYTYDFPDVEPQRLIGEFIERETTALNTEAYVGLSDDYSDSIPEWIWLRAWSPDYTSHRSVDFSTSPIDTHFRIWHIGVQPGG